MGMLMDDSPLPTWRSLENPSAVTDPCGEAKARDEREVELLPGEEK